MLRVSLLGRIKLAMLTAFAVAGGTAFTSCGLTDIRDNIVAGALGAVKATAQGWVDGVLIDLDEVFEPIPDTPIDTP